MAKKVLPQVYFDEHIKPPVVDEFREAGFKCVMIANTKRYAGREEQDYIEETGIIYLTQQNASCRLYL